MHLFDGGGGITADSRNFFRDNRHKLGEIVEAQVFFPGSAGPSAYSCILGDADGNKMWLSGLAAGYAGEGPRVAMEILVEVGFPAEQARDVFVRTPVRLHRAVGSGEVSRRSITQVDCVRTRQQVAATQRERGLRR
jgi:hypothetical protein